MNGSAASTALAQAAPVELSVAVMMDVDAPRAAVAAGTHGALRCVWSGYPARSCSCSSRVPRGVVLSAWRRELAQDPAEGDRFFRFNWQESQWLAYGLANGSVRGVYCPTHSAERDERDERAGAGESPLGEPLRELARAA